MGAKQKLRCGGNESDVPGDTSKCPRRRSILLVRPTAHICKIQMLSKLNLRNAGRHELLLPEFLTCQLDMKAQFNKPALLHFANAWNMQKRNRNQMRENKLEEGHEPI